MLAARDHRPASTAAYRDGGHPEAEAHGTEAEAIPKPKRRMASRLDSLA